MNPQDLSTTQQLIASLAGLFAIGLVFGSFFVHAWVLIAWNRITQWSGWLRDEAHDRIGLIDLLGCLLFIAMAQVALAGIYYADFKKNAPAPARPIDASSGVPTPAWILPRPSAPDRSLRKQHASVDDEAILLSNEASDSSGGEKVRQITDSPWFMLAATFSLVLGSVVSAVWTLIRTRSSPLTLGMTSGRIGRDLLVGGLVFLWITPLVLMVNIAVSQLTEIQYEHPVIESLKGRSWAFPLLFTSAVIFAPLWEEYAFRFLLVNWLGTLRSHWFDPKKIFLGRGSGELVSSLPVVSDTGLEPQSGQDLSSKYPPWWIAITSGVLFGLAHFEYGVSWVPLVVLGTVLARVYQLQRSILPCFVIHALFNSLAMVGFAFELFVKSAA